MLVARVRSMAARFLAVMDSDYRIPLVCALAVMAVERFAGSGHGMLLNGFLLLLLLGFYGLVMRSVAVAKTAAHEASRVRSGENARPQ